MEIFKYAGTHGIKILESCQLKVCDPRSFNDPFEFFRFTHSKLAELLGVRHKITHPKRAHELNISDSQLKLVEDVWKWFSAEWVRLGADCVPNRNQPREVERVLSQIPISKSFTLMCANGDVYEFATRKDLFAFVSTHKSSKNIHRAMALSFRKGEWRIIRKGKFS